MPISINTIHKNRVRALLLAATIGLYFLVGSLVNPFIFWTAMPIYLGYFLMSRTWKAPSIKKLYMAWGFLGVSVGFSYLYHILWFFDIDQFQTGSSTSAIIFVFLPPVAVVLGLTGCLGGYLLALFIGKKQPLPPL